MTISLLRNRTQLGEEARNDYGTHVVAIPLLGLFFLNVSLLRGRRDDAFVQQGGFDRCL